MVAMEAAAQWLLGDVSSGEGGSHRRASNGAEARGGAVIEGGLRMEEVREEEVRVEEAEEKDEARWKAVRKDAS